MKRISIKATIGMAAILLLTAACTDELNDRQGDTEYAIAFTPSTETRAAVESGELPENSSFNVWGWYGTENNITNQVFANNHETVTKSGDSWGYTGGTQYWIKGMTYNFYGVYPANLGECSQNGIITVNEFDCSKFGEEAVDLMTAMAQGSGDNPQPVKMLFKHALTRITFSAKLADGLTGYSLNVKEIKLQASSKGKMTQSKDNLQWDSDENSMTIYQLTAGKELINTPIKQEEGVKTLSISGNGDLLTIPQNMSEKVTLAITYTLTYNDITTSELTRTYSLNDNTVWKPGTNLNYIFTIDEDNAYFGIKIGEWADGTPVDNDVEFI